MFLQSDYFPTKFSWVIILVAIVAIVITNSACITNYQLQEKELVISNWQKLFQENVMIIVGANPTQTEMIGANDIASKLKQLSGDTPTVKKYPEVSEPDKINHNLIVIGTPSSNSILQELYEKSDATKVTFDYPGTNNGLLEVLRNPWSSDRALLSAASNDARGLANVLGAFYYLILSGIEFSQSDGANMTIEGIISEDVTAWSPEFNECTSASYFVETSDQSYYMAGLCPYLFLAPGEEFSRSKVLISEMGSQHFVGKRVEIKGKIEQRELSVSSAQESNPLLAKETFNVIVISQFATSSNSKR